MNTGTETVTAAIPLSNLRLKGHRTLSKADKIDVGPVLPELTNEHSKNENYVPNPTGASIRSPGESGDPPVDVRKARQRGHVQFSALCFCLFLAGYNDGSTGPLLPTIQRVYHLNFAIVSLLFVCACIGFIAGGLSNVWLTDRFGFGKTIVLGAIAQMIAYAIMAPAPPFPVLVTAYAINGVGIALQDAQANGFVASLADGSAVKMNLLHAVYGFGAMSSPLIATQFAPLHHWSFHYLTCLGISIANLVSLTAVFKLKTQDAILTRNGQAPAEVSTSQQSTMRQILGNKSVHLLAFFILVYVGIEVTIGGWIVTFIIDKRGGGASSGYISTGFFGGLTAGRLVLHYLTRFIPDRNTIFIYALLAMALEITIWRVPSLIGNAVCVSFIGFFLGPMYPTVMNQASYVIPRWLLTGSIGWIAGFGQAGSALLPFMTGALANKLGIASLQPLIIVAIVVVIILWTIVWRGQRRLD
ncbi:MFS general substrate transporter [Ramaria rubella]|nr:MFS general substrate transporter [Ramaria rubella]